MTGKNILEKNLQGRPGFLYKVVEETFDVHLGVFEKYSLLRYLRQYDSSMSCAGDLYELAGRWVAQNDFSSTKMEGIFQRKIQAEKSHGKNWLRSCSND